MKDTTRRNKTMKPESFRENIVYIDDREPVNVKEELAIYFNTKQIPTKITRFETGDFYYNGVMIERKDCMDFVNSWKDHRIENQRLRMKELQQKHDIHPYIIIQGTYQDIEKTINNYNGINFTKQQWIGAQNSLQEMGIGIIHLEERINHNLLAYTIDNLAHHKNKNKTYHQVYIEPDGYDWQMKAYQCIKGVGYTKAKILHDNIDLKKLLSMDKNTAMKKLIKIKGIGQKFAEKICNDLELPE